MTRPVRVNSTTVLSRLPSVAAWPWGPTPFWKAVNRYGPAAVMSSGRVSGAGWCLADPAATKVCRRLAPDRITRAVYPRWVPAVVALAVPALSAVVARAAAALRLSALR